MYRTPEQELMESAEQVVAYAQADFSVPHNAFIDLIAEYLPDNMEPLRVLDLGCGSGDICCRFAERFKACEIDAVDGSTSMIAYARQHLPENVSECIHYHVLKLPAKQFPKNNYDIIISNSLLHHLANPHTLWQTIKQCSNKGTQVFVMDLLRPQSEQQALYYLEQYAKDEDEILQRDFFNSLKAAYTIQEITTQLHENGLSLSCAPISERHVFVQGVL